MTELPECLMVVTAQVDASVEPEWNHWYDTVHLPEILECPGFLAARRYLSDEDGTRHYMTVYRLSGPQAMADEMFNRRRGWQHFSSHVTAHVRLFETVGKGKGQ